MKLIVVTQHFELVMTTEEQGLSKDQRYRRNKKEKEAEKDRKQREREEKKRENNRLYVQKHRVKKRQAEAGTMAPTFSTPTSSRMPSSLTPMQQAAVMDNDEEREHERFLVDSLTSMLNERSGQRSNLMAVGIAHEGKHLCGNAEPSTMGDDPSDALVLQDDESPSVSSNGTTALAVVPSNDGNKW